MLKIGTRGSKLALWQANNLKGLLNKKGIESELVIIKTKGDELKDLSFDKIEGKGFFTKEIEDALIAGTVHIAVHSLKDLPTSMHSELTIGGLSTRANPADILIIHPEATDKKRLLKLKSQATIGTSSIRRKVQLRQFDSEIKLVDIRGNVPSRIQKIRDGKVDAIVLAAAGIERLEIDLSYFHVITFNPTEFIPAPGQGVNAYQCRKSDKITRIYLKDIHQSSVSTCTNVERKIMNLLDGGCHLPLGAYCTKDENGNFHCTAILGSSPGAPLKRINYSSSTSSGMAQHIVTQLMTT